MIGLRLSMLRDQSLRPWKILPAMADRGSSQAFKPNWAPVSDGTSQGIDMVCAGPGSQGDSPAEPPSEEVLNRVLLLGTRGKLYRSPNQEGNTHAAFS